MLVGIPTLDMLGNKYCVKFAKHSSVSVRHVSCYHISVDIFDRSVWHATGEKLSTSQDN